MEYTLESIEIYNKVELYFYFSYLSRALKFINISEIYFSKYIYVYLKRYNLNQTIKNNLNNYIIYWLKKYRIPMFMKIVFVFKKF